MSPVGLLRAVTGARILFVDAREPEAAVQFCQYLLLKTLVHIESLGRSIYPQLDIWTLGRPLLEQWMLEQYGPTATLKKIQDRLPEWAAQLPDLPDLFRDGLENLRDMPAQQRRHEARMEQLLNRHRRLWAPCWCGWP